jgi:hypothetical protein
MENIWKNWQEVTKLAKDKKIILFGKSEDWIEKTIQAARIPLSYIVDNNVNLHGTELLGLTVHAPSKIKNEKKGSFYVLITSGSFFSIIPELVGYGLEAGKDFCCTPVLLNQKTLTDIISHKQRLLVSSPDHSVYTEIDKGKDIGGGVFIFDIESRQSQRLAKGSFHQIAKGKDVFYIIHHFEGVHIFSDKTFKLLDSFPIDENSKPHGVAYCPKRNLVITGCSGLDKMAFYDANSYKKVDEISISDRYEKIGTEQHHINDLWVDGDSLFVSMFSFSGFCKNWNYDGGIMEFNLNNLSERRIVVSNLWMPHSVQIIGGRLSYVDSMRGNLHITDKNPAGTFPWFVRGLAFDGQYYYVGVNQNRYFDRLKGISNCIMLTAGILLFDDESKGTRFFAMDNIRQIHDLWVLGE